MADRESQAARGSIPARAGEPRSRPIPHRLRRVHPRAGGGTSVIQIQTAAAKGPSPRGRGNRGSPAQAERLAGSIPARAGEPSARSHPRTRPGVHPRAGGGTRCGRSLKVSPSGPSPRGRGNPRGRRGSPGRSGSIPARAGEPPGDCTAREPGRVHPRAGGGTFSATRMRLSKRGPSPRGRGNRIGRRRDQVLGGSIPARAGEPLRVPGPDRKIGVHPRAGGGTMSMSTSATTIRGPSPRGRGNHPDGDHAHPGLGSIPARAGEPFHGQLRRVAGKVHPRAGGGTRASADPVAAGAGPSPRGRGNLPPTRKPSGGSGSIPARAGEPRAIIPGPARSRVHPRAGGGTRR